MLEPATHTPEMTSGRTTREPEGGTMDSESRSTDPVVITRRPLIAEADDFEGKPVTTIQYQGRPCWPAREIGQALGYEDDGRGLVDLVRREWAGELIENQDFMVLGGQELRDLKRLLEPNVSDTFGRHVAHLLLLFEPGVHICCVKTSKPVGLKLRRFIADRVMSQIVRDGSYLPDRQVVNGQLQRKDGADARTLAPIDLAQLAHTIHTSMRTIFHGELIPAILEELKEVVVRSSRSAPARPARMIPRSERLARLTSPAPSKTSHERSPLTTSGASDRSAPLLKWICARP
jgi:prophage antirepressor-like protein